MILRTVPVLTAATVFVSACGGGGSDSAAAPPATPTPTVTVTVSATPKAGKPKPSVTPAVAGVVATPIVTPKPTPKAPAKPAYRVAMPDGRTSPQESDWDFKNLKLFRRNTSIAGTVDVTYKGPGLASMLFTVLVTYTNTTSDGQELKDTMTFKGSVSAMRPDATESVSLGGGKDTLFFDDSTTYDGVYTIDSMSDDDPKAKPN